MNKTAFGLILTLCFMSSLILILSTGKETYSQSPPYLPLPPQPVVGRYLNPEFGIEMVFPDGLEAMEISPGPGITITSTYLPTQPPDMALMGIFMTDLLKKTGVSNATQLESDSDKCLIPSLETVTIGGKSAQVRDQPCEKSSIGFGGFGAFPKYRSYFVNLGSGRTVELLLNSDPSVYDSSLKTFEEIVKTIKFSK